MGLLNTILLVSLSLFFGGILAVVLALVRTYRLPVLSEFVWLLTYVERGSPLLVQLYLIYYGLSQFVFVRESILWVILGNAWWCALIAFSLNTAAYTSEIIRGGIKSIPRGEIEAAKACGMSVWSQLRSVILPRGFRYALPAYGNEVIFMIHSSAVVSTITVIDILGAGRTLNGKYYVVYEGFLMAALLYIVVIFITTKFMKGWERRWLDFLVR
jgi:arginine/ornithine transport system permease protein